jgi:hypothetical protein
VDVPSSTLSGAEILFDVGKPENHAVIEESLSLTPKFVELYTT